MVKRPVLGNSGLSVQVQLATGLMRAFEKPPDGSGGEADEASGASRNVVCVGKRGVGYYTLAVGAVALAEATGRVRRNMPDPVPVMLLGRLAVDKDHQLRGIGTGLLRDAILRYDPSRGDRRHPSHSSACNFRRGEALL